MQIQDMIKQINSKKSKLSLKGKKQCGMLGVDNPKLKQVTVEDIVKVLY